MEPRQWRLAMARWKDSGLYGPAELDGAPTKGSGAIIFALRHLLLRHAPALEVPNPNPNPNPSPSPNPDPDPNPNPNPNPNPIPNPNQVSAAKYNYHELQLRSRFALTPAGNGLHSSRLMEATRTRTRTRSRTLTRALTPTLTLTLGS